MAADAVVEPLQQRVSLVSEVEQEQALAEEGLEALPISTSSETIPNSSSSVRSYKPSLKCWSQSSNRSALVTPSSLK